MKKYFWLILLFSTSHLLQAQQLVFTHQPTNQSACESGDQVFYVETDTAGFDGAQMIYKWMLFDTQNWLEVDTTDPHFGLVDNMLYVLNSPLSLNEYMFSCVISVGGYEFESDTATLLVNSNPTVDFEYDGHCFGETTAFINTTQDLDNFESWHWDFGDDNCPDSSLYPNTNHYFCAPGQYQVTLEGVDQNGCHGQSTKVIEVFDVIPPEINGPDIACSYQENIKFFSNNDYETYRWSLEDGQLPCTLQTDTTFDVLLDCELAEFPSQFNVRLKVTDQQGCSKYTMKEFLVLTYRSPENAIVVRKPENSNLLICLLEDTTNMVFNWAKTLKSNPSDTLENYITQNNYVLFQEDINLSLYDYSVEVINTAENYCSSTFYLKAESTDNSSSNVIIFENKPSSISVNYNRKCFLYMLDENQEIVMHKTLWDGKLELLNTEVEKGSYRLILVENNMIIANTSFVIN